jgi:hypothetical protein
MAQKASRRRKRGRPRKDEDDQEVVDLAAAFAKVRGLGPQRARDLALSWLEGTARKHTPEEREKLPRRFRRSALPLLTHELAVSYKGREGGIAEKLASGQLKPRPDVVDEIVKILRAKDEELVHLALAIVRRLLAAK